MKVINKILLGAACVATLSVAQIASADPIIFTGSIGTRSASATFDVSADGSQLIVTLANISTADALVPIDILTAVFFDYDKPPTLTPVSAVVAPGSAVHFGVTDPGGVVGGEFAYKDGLTGAPSGAALGISSVGLGLFGPGDVFPGSNLQGPAEPDGLQYGLTSAGDNLATGNTPVTGANALIKNAVVFTFNGMTGFTLQGLNLRNVQFQYGTALSEPQVPGTTPDGGLTLVLLGFVASGLSLVRSRMRR